MIRYVNYVIIIIIIIIHLSIAPFRIYDHHRAAIKPNDRICTTQRIVSLKIIVTNGKTQKNTKKTKKLVKTK